MTTTGAEKGGEESAPKTAANETDHQNNSNEKNETPSEPAENQTIQPENQPTEPENHTTKLENQTNEPENQTIKLENQTTKSENQPTEPENPPTKPEKQPTKPENQPTKPESKKEQNGKSIKSPENTLKPVSAFRTALPQVLASSAKNLLLLDLGMTIAFPTIVIPALLEGRDTKGLIFNPEHASWFGSIVYICQPLGSVLSGFALEPLGRKHAMMVVNLPHVLGWFLLYSASTRLQLYLAAVIMGLGVGFMEAPIITYVGEISQPNLRGTLTSYSNLFVSFGLWFIFTLGAVVDWRTAAAISIAVPLATILAISQVPETPQWLMARGRLKDAEAALCWLRGWVSPEHIQKELDELRLYTEGTKLKKEGIANPAFTADDGSPVQTEKEFVDLSLTEKVKDFARPGMIKPLALIIGFFFFANFTGTTPTRPYMVKIAEEFEMPLNPYSATMVFGSVGFVGSVMCMLTIAKFKKRPIALASMAIASLSALLLGFISSSQPWFSFILYILLNFFSFYGAGGLVWTLVSEVFPFRGRSMASGLAAAASYLISFVATKSFLTLHTHLSLHGVFILYGVMSLGGLVFLYFLMPETEGRPLEEIEKDYEGKKEAAAREKREEAVRAKEAIRVAQNMV